MLLGKVPYCLLEYEHYESGHCATLSTTEKKKHICLFAQMLLQPKYRTVVSAAGQAKTQPTGSVTILLSGKVPHSRVIFPCTLHRPGIDTRVSFGLGTARSRNNEMNGSFSGKIIPMSLDDAMEFTISPRATVNHGRLLPWGFRMHNRLAVPYDITSHEKRSGLVWGKCVFRRDIS